MKKHLLLALSSVLLLASGCGEDAVRPTPEMTDEPLESGLYLAPIPGITTTWHALNNPNSQDPDISAKDRNAEIIWAPENAVVGLAYFHGPGTSVQWVGASRTSSDGRMSLAECPVQGSEDAVITMIVDLPGGDRFERSCVVKPVRVSSQSLIAPKLSVGNLTLTSSPDAGDAKEMFFSNESIADVTIDDAGRIVTSADRTIVLEAVPSLTQLAGLMEWRVDGEAVSVGRSFVVPKGAKSITVGPPGLEVSATIQTYTVTIDAPFEPLPENVDLTLHARTEPPGFEDRVRWMTSTSFGKVEPATGLGSSFTVRLSDTFGPYGSQWLGVKADHAKLNQDQKNPPPVIQSISPLTGGEGTVVTVTGSGFGNRPEDLCFTVLSGTKTLPFEVLTATDTQVTARLGPVLPGDTGGPIMIQPGQGEYDLTPPSVFGLTPLDRLWSWQPDGTPAAQSAQTFTPVSSAKKTVTEYSAQIVGDDLVLNWVGGCPPGTLIEVFTRVADGPPGSPFLSARKRDFHWKSYEMAAGSEDFVANTICALVAATFFDKNVDYLGCEPVDLGPGLGHDIKITVTDPPTNVVIAGDLTVRKTVPKP